MNLEQEREDYNFLLLPATLFLEISLVLQSEMTVLISVMGKRATTQGHGFVTVETETIGPRNTEAGGSSLYSLI